MPIRPSVWGTAVLRIRCPEDHFARGGGGGGSYAYEPMYHCIYVYIYI